MPIVDLPTELLVIIFYAYVDKLANSFELVRLTQVCRQWRDIALSFPALWGFISISQRPHIVSKLLTLSKDTPIHVSWSRTIIPLSMHKLQPYIARIMTVDITSVELAYMRRFLSLFEANVTCPILTSLHIQLVKIPYGNTVFSAQAPLLRHVMLERVALPWGEWKYTGLTHLVLEHLHQHIAPSISQLREIFAECTALEEVSLTNVTCPMPVRTIELHCLKKLHISYKLPEAVPPPSSLFVGLVVPKFTLFSFDYNLIEIESILPRNIDSFSNLRVDDDTLLRFAPQTVELLRPSEPHCLAQSGLQVVLRIHSSHPNPRAVHDLFNLLDVSRLHSLEVTDADITGWRTNFPKMSLLTTLKLGGQGGPLVIYHHLLQDSLQTPPCPALTRLVFLTWEAGSLTRTVEFLKKRANMGVPLREVVYENCGVDEVTADTLRAVGLDVLVC
jgi:F-box-like